MIDFEALALAGTLAGINMALITYVTAPLKQNPAGVLAAVNWLRRRLGLAEISTLGWWWLTYVALASGLAMALAAGLNVAPALGWMGVVLTGVVIGGGASVFYDVVDR